MRRPIDRLRPKHSNLCRCVAYGLLALPMALRSLPVQAVDVQSFDSAGVKIAFTEQGHGPPVVLIHGYTASGAMNWGLPGTTNLVAERYRTVVIDNRGHGKSDKPIRAEDYGVNMAEDVIRLLDHLQIAKAHLVGYSMGGMITLKLLATHPDRILSAVVGGMGWLEGPGEIAPAALAADGDNAKRPLVACARSFPALGISREELLSIKVPFTVIVGADDGLLGRRVDPLRAVRPDVPMVVIPGANHLSCVFRPELRESIRAFLDRQPQPSP